MRKGDMVFRVDSSRLEREVEQLESDVEKGEVENKMNEVSVDEGNMREWVGVREEEGKKGFGDREGKGVRNELNEKVVVVREKEI
ncbi:hypothetical protein, partial [Paenibacillus xylanexedens]|uniref:hypothetical protein n=1 Tax=Paenibacillus xylanexedens TaxID=528191 RepID=UPI0011A7ACA1